jgi:hypothetical protein
VFKVVFIAEGTTARYDAADINSARDEVEFRKILKTSVLKQCANVANIVGVLAYCSLPLKEQFHGL